MSATALAPGARWTRAPRDLWCTHPSHRHAPHRSRQENAKRRIAEGDLMLWIATEKGAARCLRCALAEGHALPEEALGVVPAPRTAETVEK